ncbi:hypothetical protein MnBA_40690 [Marinobacterium sp. BA1]
MWLSKPDRLKLTDVIAIWWLSHLLWAYGCLAPALALLAWPAELTGVFSAFMFANALLMTHDLVDFKPKAVRTFDTYLKAVILAPVYLFLRASIKHR